MKRIVLFLATNIAIMLVLGVVLQLLGVERLLNEQGTELDLKALLVFSAVFGMGGSFISLAMSKWMAKRATGARVIEQPSSDVERWLVDTVSAQAKVAGIGMPEVAIFESPAPNAFATGARKDAALVAVSTGLLRGMKKDEVEAVLGHEISHVANGDMITLALIQGVVNTFVIFLSRVVGLRRRPRRLQDRARTRAGVFHHVDRGAGGDRIPREPDRVLVLAATASSAPTRRCAARRSRQDDRRPRAAEIGRSGRAARSDGGVRDLGQVGRWIRAPVLDPPEPRRPHCRVARARCLIGSATR